MTITVNNARLTLPNLHISAGSDKFQNPAGLSEEVLLSSEERLLHVFREPEHADVMSQSETVGALTGPERL